MALGEIGEDQEFILEFPKGVQIENIPEVIVSGDGLEIKGVELISRRAIKITYDRSYTTSSNRIDIENLAIKSDLAPGTYQLLPSNAQTAIQNGNTPQDSVSHTELRIFPALTVNDLPYDDSFELEDNLWEGHSERSIWEWGEPNGSTINRASTGNMAWMTDLDSSYSVNVHSWLYSPCFDLTQLTRPAVSLDYWNDSEVGLDGVVIQVSTDLGATWTTLGTDSTGINWFDTNLLLANPGDQPTDQQHGWTGEENGWKRGSHRIPTEFTSAQTRFRIAFRSSDFINPTKQLNGFAFDNFFLGNRTRRVLLEYFPQASSENLRNVLETLYAEFGFDVIPLVYHVDTRDPINQVNPIDPEARALYYGISSSDNVVLGGNDFKGELSLLNSRALDTSSLKTASFAIEIDSLFRDPYSVKVMVTPRDSWEEELILYVGIVENGVIQASDTLDYVLRKFLPTAQGTRLSNLISDVPQSLEFQWEVTDNIPPTIVQDPDSLYVVAFLQDPNSRAILQTARTGNPASFGKKIPTSRRPPFSETLQIYPNPIQDKIWIKGRTHSHQNFKLRLINLQGKIVYEGKASISSPDRVVNLPQLPSGVYLVEILDHSTILKREKIVILRP